MTAHEIERKFLIVKPDLSWLEAQTGEGCEEITQTYLLSDPGEEIRLRRILTQGKETYVATVKRTITAIRREEYEEELSGAQYHALLGQADPQRRTIEKMRYHLPSGKHVAQIDIYPFFKKCAILEIELADEEEAFCLPDGVSVLREVTEDPRYKNAALASLSDPGQLE